MYFIYRRDLLFFLVSGIYFDLKDLLEGRVKATEVVRPSGCLWGRYQLSYPLLILLCQYFKRDGYSLTHFATSKRKIAHQFGIPHSAHSRPDGPTPVYSRSASQHQHWPTLGSVSVSSASSVSVDVSEVAGGDCAGSGCCEDVIVELPELSV